MRAGIGRASTFYVSLFVRRVSGYGFGRPGRWIVSGMRTTMRCGVFAVGLLVALNINAQAAVREFRIESRKGFPADNRFELLEGRFSGALDPDDPHNRIINDLKLAPRDSNGKVAYAATFKLLKPVDMSIASGVLVYDVPNRGHGAVMAFPQGHVSVI